MTTEKENTLAITAINWNSIKDPMDLEVWNRLNTNFWLPEKIALSNDKPSWSKMTEAEKEATRQVFGGLTLLDTLQSEVGAPVMQADARTEHEAAVFANITHMEAIHAQSYSAIFSTLCSTEEIDQIFHWVETNDELQAKAAIINSKYREMQQYSADYQDAVRKAASVMLESFLFYSGFYLPLKMSSQGKLTNTADIIRLILRDEGVHGFYIGYKFQQVRDKLTEEQKKALDEEVKTLLEKLYRLEMKYTEDLYDPIGWTENVKKYLNYNANKAMMNLGYEPLIDESKSQPEAVILSSMAIDANENHDFFSGSGSSYVIGKVEETSDDDWS